MSPSGLQWEMTSMEAISKEAHWLASQTPKQNIEKGPNSLAKWRRAKPPASTSSGLLTASQSDMLLDRNQHGAKREAWQQDGLPLNMALAFGLCRVMSPERPQFPGLLFTVGCQLAKCHIRKEYRM